MATHHEQHMTRIEAAKSDDVRTQTVYESDGSDGYSVGTWGYLVSVGGWSDESRTYARGGYASREKAASAAQLAAR